MKRPLICTALLILGATAIATAVPAGAADFGVAVNLAPPAPRNEALPLPRHGAVWLPGYWNWDGRHHVWLAGHWETARSGYRYQAPEWRRDHDGWHLARGVWLPAAALAVTEEIIAPPAPRFEPVPPPRPGYFWAGGHWEWRGHRHEWTGGEWIAERPGFVYAAPSWSMRDGRWVMEPGRWNEHGREHERRHDR